MRLSELEGDRALDALADIIEPAIEIMTDEELKGLVKAGRKGTAVAVAIKNHKKAVTTIVAIMDGEDPATYVPKFTTLPIKLLELFNDPDLIQLFQEQGQTEETFSGSAMVNTRAEEQ